VAAAEENIINSEIAETDATVGKNRENLLVIGSLNSLEPGSM
jgi:hypothetical protein